MLDDVAAHTAACDAARDAYSAAMKAAGDPAHVYGAAEDDCPGCKVRVPLDETRRAALDAAWDALKASSDPLVAWIAEHARDYEHEATIVLRALPTSMDALDAMANNHGWCDAWRTLRARADLAGVLPAGSEVSA